MSEAHPVGHEPAFDVTPRPEPPATAPKRPRRTGRGRLLLAGALGFVLASGVAAVLDASGVLPTPGGSLQRSTDPITLPVRAGSFVVQEAALESARSTKTVAAALATVNSRSRAALRRAYGGAAADVHVYATQELLAFLTVSAVRSNSPRLYAVYQDPTATTDHIVSYGPVDCELVPSAAPGRRRLQASSVRTCQRTGNGLTVRIDNLVGLDGTRPQAVVAILDEIWAKLN